MLAFVTRVLMLSHVVPRPSVKTILFNVSDVVGDEIIAEVVALVDGAPELPGLRMDGDANSVANARGVNAFVLSVGSESQYVCAMVFQLSIVIFVIIGMRADAD